MFIGLMGVANDGTMFTPNGRRLFRLPWGLSWQVQRIQHWIARLTHERTTIT